MPTPPPQPPAEPPEYFEHPHSAATPPRRKLSRRASILGTTIALVLAAGLAWLAWDLTRPAQTAAAGPGGPGGGRGGATTVGFAVAEAASVPVNLDALGTVVPLATVRVRPQVSGVLQQLNFREGQTVRRGALLAVIDPRPFEMALQQATGQRMRDEAQLAAARVTLARFETLLQQDSIARQEVDTQRATVRQLEATVVSSKAAEGTARLNLGYTRIVAPIDGRLGLREVDVGNTVGPSDTNGVAVITKLTPIDVEFAIPQDHAAWLQHNAGAFMEVKVSDRTRTTLLDTGVFASLDNQIDTQTGTVRAKARFNNARQQLFPSQFVNVQLTVRTIENAVMVPVAAVRQGGQGDFVFVLQQDRTVKMRPVVRGEMQGDRVQIASGLQVGERVITEGADRLRDGARVTLPGDAPRAAGGANGQRRRGGQGAASAPLGAASDALQGASAAQGTAAQRQATAPWAPASAMMGAAAAPGEAAAAEKLTPQEREQRQRQRREARQAASAARP
jgi:multidrug efflux system membrane fusion protein